MNRTIVAICSILFAILPGPTSAAVALGDKPTLKLPAMDGSTIDLAAHKGKLILIDFWAGRSQTTRAAQAKVAEVYKKYSDQGLVVIGINCDAKLKDAESIIEELEIKWPTYHEREGRKSGVPLEWGVAKLPYYFIIAPEGQVIWAGYKSGIDDIVAEEMIRHPPKLLDADDVARANATLDAVEEALKEKDAAEAVGRFTKFDEKAKKDVRIGKRWEALSKKINEAADELIAQVDAMVKEKKYPEAATKLKELSKSLAGIPKAAAVRKRIAELSANPEAKDAMVRAEKESEAAAALAAAKKLREDAQDEDAFLKLKALIKDYAETEAARTASDMVVKYEADDAFMRRVRDRAASEKAKIAMSLAENYRQGGRNDLARLKYQQVIKDFPQTSFADEAQKALAELKEAR